MWLIYVADFMQRLFYPEIKYCILSVTLKSRAYIGARRGDLVLNRWGGSCIKLRDHLSIQILKLEVYKENVNIFSLIAVFKQSCPPGFNPN